jgi:hypothetical protein
MDAIYHLGLRIALADERKRAAEEYRKQQVAEARKQIAKWMEDGEGTDLR